MKSLPFVFYSYRSLLMLESVNYHLSGMNVVIGALHGKFSFLDFLCYRRISHYALRLHPCVQSYGSVKAVALSYILRYIVANRRKQFAEFALLPLRR